MAHKTKCLAIHSLHRRLSTRHEALDNSLFRTAVGCFSAHGPSLTYCRVRSDLINALTEIANEQDTAEAWNMILDHQLEMLRLDRYDFCGIRLSVVFTLLRLGRDDDCVSLIKIFLDPITAKEHFANLPDTESSPGEWIFRSHIQPHDPVDCRFENIISDLRLNMDDILFPFLVALLICKLRIFAEHEARVAELSALLQSTAFQKLEGSDDILPAVKRAVVGDESTFARVQSQTPMADRLMVGITKRNLQAMINSENLDCLSSMDRAVFEQARRFFRVTTGAKERVKAWIASVKNDDE